MSGNIYKNIEIAIDRKGNHTLAISNNGPIAKLPIDPAQVSKVNGLVDAVRTEMIGMTW